MRSDSKSELIKYIDHRNLRLINDECKKNMMSVK